MMPRRRIVHIDEEKCNGCGLCVPSCAEGALQIIGGKARLVSEIYCDGLGACLGECPEGALRLEEREAQPFDEESMRQHVAGLSPTGGEGAAQTAPSAGGCPGSAMQDLRLNVLGSPAVEEILGQEAAGPQQSALGHWPIQLHLVPPQAPFLQNANLLLVADCVPFAFADFHNRFLRQRPVVIGCPKLDNAEAYVDKLAAIFTTASPQSLTVVHMEVPCCAGLTHIAQAALERSGEEVLLEDVTISIRGRVLSPGPQRGASSPGHPPT